MGVFSVCLIGLWFFWLLIDVWYPVFQLQGWQSLLQHRVQGEFHGRWDGRRWTHDISACTSEQLTFGQWSYFPTDLLSEISNNLIWSYLKCCLRLISCSHGCDHVCGVVAWRFCLCGADEFTSPIDFFVLRSWILEFFGGLRRMTVPPVILLSWSEMGVCVSEHEFGCLDLIFSGCRMFDASVTIMYLNLCFQYVFRKGNGKLWYQ